MSQVTDTVLMVRPASFRKNEETAVNNYYQKVLDNLSAEQTQENALNEFNAFVEINFEQNPDIKAIFAGNLDPKEIIISILLYVWSATD